MIERFLFVVGGRDTGKSTQLRSIFRDPRLGTNGQVPTNRSVRDRYRLSIDRGLYIRLTSPHEAGESLRQFLDKTDHKTQGRRWCVAAPLQLDAFKTMPDLTRTVAAVIARFTPERIRVCALSPDRHGTALPPAQLDALFDVLWSLGPVECHALDARQRTRNDTLLAGFLDFA